MSSLATVGPADAPGLVCPWCGRSPDRAVEGLSVSREGRLVGVLLWAPSDRDRDLCPVSSWIVDRLWVTPDDVGEHIGTQLLTRAAATARSRGVRRLVAYGTRQHPDCRTPPAGWLERSGFIEHIAGVQWRLDLARTAPVRDALRAAAQAGAALVRGRRGAPAVGRTTHQG